jgi:hemerythrin-like domain-containing protein
MPSNINLPTKAIMVQKKFTGRDIVKVLEADHARALRQADHFGKVILHLRFEGIPRLGKNLKDVKQALKFFEKELSEHLELENRGIFPYLETHIPRLEPVIRLFYSDHAGFKENLKRFRTLLRRLAAGKRMALKNTELMENLRETGTCMIYLLKHHLQSESASVYRAIARELRSEEVKDLAKRITMHTRL